VCGHNKSRSKWELQANPFDCSESYCLPAFAAILELVPGQDELFVCTRALDVSAPDDVVFQFCDLDARAITESHPDVQVDDDHHDRANFKMQFVFRYALWRFPVDVLDLGVLHVGCQEVKWVVGVNSVDGVVGVFGSPVAVCRRVFDPFL
jgi:hypothetical protein